MRFPLAFVVLALAACASSSSAGGARPGSFVLSTAESRNTRVIDVRDGFARATALKALTDVLGQYSTVEVTDSRAGFAMTSWQATLVRDGVPDLRYRTRLIGQFVGDDWRKLQLRHEANWRRGDEWDVGYDAVQLDSVASELRTKLGRRP